MDWTSLIGLALAVGGILVGQSIEGSKLSLLLQPTSFLIVVAGTLGAVLLQSRASRVRRAVRMLRWIARPPQPQYANIAQDVSNWNLTVRRDGHLALERFAEQHPDPFVVKGLRLVVDGAHPAKLLDVLGVEISAHEAAERQAIKVWEAAGGYAPTIGILGAVLGLTHVMENLSNPGALGSGIAVAFVSTIYGVGLANLVFLPVANKLKTIVAGQIATREVLAAIFADLAGGDNARVIEERVASLLVQEV